MPWGEKEISIHRESMEVQDLQDDRGTTFLQKKNLTCIALLHVPVLYSLERRADGWSQYWLILYNCELIQFILMTTSH